MAACWDVFCCCNDGAVSQAESALRTELGTLTEKVEARFTAMGEKVEGRFSSLLGEVRRGVEAGESARQGLAEELLGYHTSDATRMSELERRMLESEVSTEQALARRIEEATSVHKAEVVRVEER